MLPTIPDQIRAHALRRSSRVALVEHNPEQTRILSYSELYCAGIRLGKILENALRATASSTSVNNRIALLAGNVLEMHVFYLACAIYGFVAIPINITFTPREIAEVLLSSSANLVFCERRFEPSCKSAIQMLSTMFNGKLLKYHLLDKIEPKEDLDMVEKEPRPGSMDTLLQPWAMLHTSGTTSGKKKGVIRNQLGTVAGIFVHQTALKLTEDDTYMAVWPSYGISSFFFTFGVLYLGGTVIILDADIAADPIKSWEILLEEEVTFVTGSPLHFENWSRVAKRNPSDFLRVALLSGATISAQNKVTLADALGEKCLVCEAYGSTECGVITLSTDVSKEGVGCEPPGIPRVVFDKGTQEILVSVQSPMFMVGYALPHEEAKEYFTSNGWFRTGDVGRRDGEGNIVLLGRVDDRIGLSNGHDLYPAEVEVVLTQIVVDRQLIVSLVEGELVGILTGPPSEQLVRDLMQHAEANLAPIKRPSKYIFIDEMPMTTTNKVKRKELAQVVRAKL